MIQPTPEPAPRQPRRAAGFGREGELIPPTPEPVPGQPRRAAGFGREGELISPKPDPMPGQPRRAIGFGREGELIQPRPEPAPAPSGATPGATADPLSQVAPRPRPRAMIAEPAAPRVRTGGRAEPIHAASGAEPIRASGEPVGGGEAPSNAEHGRVEPVTTEPAKPTVEQAEAQPQPEPADQPRENVGDAPPSSENVAARGPEGPEGPEAPVAEEEGANQPQEAEKPAERGLTDRGERPEPGSRLETRDEYRARAREARLRAKPPAPVNLKHVFHGEINVHGKAVGFHHEGSIGHAGYARIKPGAAVTPENAFGVYRAKVQVFDPATGNWVNKGPTSSFFPKGWPRAKVLDQIRLAFEGRSRMPITGKSPQYWESISPSGVVIGGYTNSAGGIATAFPIY
jgi:hypothetical protein